MNYKAAITTLKTEAAKNPALNACLHMFAVRKRSRGRLTIRAMRRAMGKEGFSYTPDQYRAVLTVLAAVGFGTLEKTPKGEIRAIKDVKVTFQSIGQLVGGGSELTPFTKRKRYVKLEGSPATPGPVPAPFTAPDLLQVGLALTINGKPLDVSGLTPKEIVQLASRLSATSYAAA